MTLQVKHISYRYGKQSPWILTDLSFSVTEKERVGIIAPSGFGKSTLANIMAGLIQPSTGEIVMKGEDTCSQPSFNPIQLIFQQPELAVNPRWKMAKILSETGQHNPEILSDLGIKAKWLDRFPRELSGGELQRFCVARALAPATRFLIADEISTMLDTVTQAQLWRVILTEVEQRGIGLVVISHNTTLLEKICTRIIDLRTLNKRE